MREKLQDRAQNGRPRADFSGQVKQDLVVLSKQDLVELMEVVARTVTMAVEKTRQARLPVYYKFPEDIVEITGGYIAVSTIRGWKSAGYLRTVKIGAKSYVKPEDWEWFLAHHKELMANSARNRGDRLSK